MGEGLEYGLPWAKTYDPAVPLNLEYPEVTLCSLLQQTAVTNGGQTALIFFGKTLSYAELADYVSSTAKGLKQLQLAKGDKMAIILPNCPQYVISYYAALAAGLTVVPVNPLSTASELQYIFRDSGAKVVVCLDLLAGRLEDVRDKLRQGGEHQLAQHVYYTSLKDFMPFPLKLLYPWKQKIPPAAKARLGECKRFLRLLDNPGGPLELPQVDVRKDLAVLIYTGGTTGKPKGVMLSHYALVVNATQVSAWAVPEGEDRRLTVLPLFHGFGMSVCMNSTIVSGGSSLLVPRFDAGDVLKQMAKYKPTMFAGVPTLYIALINHPKFNKSALASLKACYVGAAALAPEVKKQFEELTGGRLMEGYGLTEAVTAICANPYNGTNKTGSIGMPFSDVVMAVRDVETGEQQLPPNEAGEIVLQSPSVMLGYYQRPEETAQVLRNGWLYTGDIGYMDEDGYFYIVDRKKDMIITGGFNVYPREVEDVLYSHPLIKEASVIGVPDPYKGERVKAFVILKEGTALQEAEVIAFCRERLIPYKVPRQVEFCQELPKTAIGKILKRALREIDRQPDAQQVQPQANTARGESNAAEQQPSPPM